MQTNGTASAARLDRLKKTLQQELSKEWRLIPGYAQQSRHRQCALSTHASLPSTDHRIPVPATPSVRCAKMTEFKESAAVLRDVDPVESMPATDLQRLSMLRQDAVCKSEWALLSTLDAQQAIDEAAQRKEHHRNAQLATRRALTSQIQEVKERAMEEQQQKEADKRLVEQATLKFQADEQDRLTALHTKHQKMKDDAAKEVQLYRHKQAQKLRIKMEDETMELQQIQQDLHLRQEMASQRKEVMRAEQHQLQLENQARIAAKEAARAQAVADDRRLMQETLRSLEVKEQQRLADIQAFHEMIARRGENAGKQVLKEAHERAEREERLIREMEAQKAAEEQQKIMTVAAVKAKTLRDVDASRQRQLKLQEQLKQETYREENQFVSEVQAKAKHAAYVERVNMQAQRLAALQNQEFIQMQMAEKLERDFLDDTDMSTRERNFMKPQLAKARDTVKQPRHINIF